MRRLAITSLIIGATLLIIAAYLHAAEVITVKWNQTGYYIKVYPITNMPKFPNAILLAHYDLSHYKYASATVTIGADDILLANDSGLYILPHASTSGAELEIEPHICVNITGRIYCNWGSSVEYVPISITGTPITVEEFINICLVVAYQPIHTISPMPHISFQLYDPYNQKLIFEADWNSSTSREICGVPPMVFINLTYDGEWLGMYYVSTVPSRGTFPAGLAPLACILVFSFFLCFALRNNPKRMGMGMIILGVLLTPLIAAFHLAGTGYYGVIAEGISAGLFVLGVALLLLSGRQAQW